MVVIIYSSFYTHIMLTLPGVDAFTFSPFHRHPDLYKPTTRPHPRYNKVDPTSDYEIATIEAEENAKQLAEELDISIAFFDWINVVRGWVGGWMCGLRKQKDRVEGEGV
jgi:hypothetical protein